MVDKFYLFDDIVIAKSLQTFYTLLNKKDCVSCMVFGSLHSLDCFIHIMDIGFVDKPYIKMDGPDLENKQMDMLFTNTFTNSCVYLHVANFNSSGEDELPRSVNMNNDIFIDDDIGKITIVYNPVSLEILIRKECDLREDDDDHFDMSDLEKYLNELVSEVNS